MSPGNGYFKQDVVNKILSFGIEKHEHLGVFIPDVPAISTYVALGYPENIARREKAIPQGNNLRNKVKKSIQEQGLNPENILVFDWRSEHIDQHHEYRKNFDYLTDLYKCNDTFRKDINSATEAVLLDNPFKKKEPTIEDIEIGTHYILSEFAFMLFSPDYLPQYTTFIYGYHKPWPVWEKFIAGTYDGKTKNSLHFLQLPDFYDNNHIHDF